MVNRKNLAMDSQIKREKESTFGVITKFDSRINSWGDLVCETGATPNRCTYSHFERNLVDSARAIYHLTRVKMHSMRYSKSNRALNNLPSSQGLLTRFDTMGTTSPELGRKE
jgi:hypothetical protein